MGWFNKKQSNAKPAQPNPMQPRPGSLPELPKLPELPELPPLEKPPKKEPSRQLPKIPNNSFGKKFSQNTIKDAVKGTPAQTFSASPEKELEDEYEESEFPMVSKPAARKTPKPLPTPKFSFPKTKEVEPMDNDFSLDEYETPDMAQEEIDEVEKEPVQEFAQQRSPIRRKEPVFIRIDKFEEALKTFDKTKKEILGIEKVLHDIAQVREDEDKELTHWQNNIVKIKDQVEKVDNDIFSRIE